MDQSQVCSDFKGWVSGKYLIEKTGSTPRQNVSIENGYLEPNDVVPSVLECNLPTVSTILRYYFQFTEHENLLVTLTKGVAVKLEEPSLRTVETGNLLFPEYQLSTDAQSHPYQIQFQDDYELSITQLQEDGSVVEGECTFRDNKATHIVVNTVQEKEPWLNLRQKPSIDSKILKKLPDGTELRVESFKDNWALVNVVTRNDLHNTEDTSESIGWVSIRYIHQLDSNEH